MATETMTADEDRLPWLEAVEDEDDKGGPSAAKLIGALIIGLVAIAAVIFAFFQLGNRDSGGTQDVEMIAAEDGGVYKEAPQTPGGMKVDGEGDTAYA
ncbi:MAG TPA: SPOR domain-containing protein, partial [Sphingomonadaceae bacterium]|nr:SPOR domain-containing protein [Sphingomonadaceae bacterium]